MRTFISCLVLFASTQSLVAATVWMKIPPGETSCSVTCSQNGLENVLAPKAKLSVCAVKFEDEFLPGTNSDQAGVRCRTRVGRKGMLVIGSAGDDAHCLCADDGSNRGSDYAWIGRKESHTDCSETCRETMPKYTYAAYGSYQQPHWLHVCASATGEIGYVDHSLKGCSAEVNAEVFGCLCTQMYSGNLDQQKDP